MENYAFYYDFINSEKNNISNYLNYFITKEAPTFRHGWVRAAQRDFNTNKIFLGFWRTTQDRDKKGTKKLLDVTESVINLHLLGKFISWFIFSHKNKEPIINVPNKIQYQNEDYILSVKQQPNLSVDNDKYTISFFYDNKSGQFSLALTKDFRDFQIYEKGLRKLILSSVDSPITKIHPISSYDKKNDLYDFEGYKLSQDFCPYCVVSGEEIKGVQQISQKDFRKIGGPWYRYDKENISLLTQLIINAFKNQNIGLFLTIFNNLEKDKQVKSFREKNQERFKYSLIREYALFVAFLKYYNESKNFHLDINFSINYKKQIIKLAKKQLIKEFQSYYNQRKEYEEDMLDFQRNLELEKQNKIQQQIDRGAEEHNKEITNNMEENKKFNFDEVLNEGGNAIKSSSPIRGDLAMGVANQIIDLLKQKYPNTRFAPLGSTGKKGKNQMSGDLDIAVELNYSEAGTIESFLKEKYPNMETNYLKGFHILSIGFPFKDENNNDKIVQCDLMFFPNISLAQYFYYSPDFTKNQSQFKGLVRNMLMLNILKNIPVKGQENTTFDNGHPKDIYKYTLQPEKGLVSIHQSYVGAKGQENKSKKTIKEDTKVILTDPRQITKFMLGEKADAENIISFESVVDWMINGDFPYKDKNEQIFKDFYDYIDNQNPEFSEKVREYINKVQNQKNSVQEEKTIRKTLKNVLSEAWSAMETEDTEDNVEQELNDKLNDNWPCKFKDPIVYKAFENKLGHPITIGEARAMTIFDFTWFNDYDYEITSFDEFAEYFINIKKIEKFAFQYCGKLTSITIPNSVIYIKEYAFSNCEKLTSITIPNSVTRIKYATFNSCTNLKSITISGSVTSIEEYTFSYCTNLKSINIPASVTSIGTAAFSNCKSLTSINIPNSVTKIGGRAFEKCESLTSINIPNSVKRIETETFSNCKSLTSITIPDSVTCIEQIAFAGCEKLTSINIPNSVTCIETGAFQKCKSLTTVKMSNSVTSIGEFAFSNCIFLTSIIIPNSIKRIEIKTFSNCQSLTTVKIPNSVTRIRNYAFENCQNLTSINIPNSVTKIGGSAFFGCINLKHVEWKGNTYNSFKEFYNDFKSINEAWNTMSTEDTDDEIENELNYKLNFETPEDIISELKKEFFDKLGWKSYEEDNETYDYIVEISKFDRENGRTETRYELRFGINGYDFEQGEYTFTLRFTNYGFLLPDYKQISKPNQWFVAMVFDISKDAVLSFKLNNQASIKSEWRYSFYYDSNYQTMKNIIKILNLIGLNHNKDASFISLNYSGGLPIEMPDLYHIIQAKTMDMDIFNIDELRNENLLEKDSLLEISAMESEIEDNDEDFEIEDYV